MQANQMHRVALSDASGRANLSPARPVGKKPTNGPFAIPSFNEFMTMTNAKQAAAKTVGRPAPSTVAAPKFALPTAPKATTASAGSKKRKSEATLEEDIAAYKQNLDHIVSPDDFEDEALPSCKAVRTRINKLLDSNIMNKTEFSNAIGVSTRSLSSFLQASGQMGGSGSAAYPNAWAWFRQREVAKIKMPDVKKRQKLEADAAAAAAATAQPSTSANAGAGGKPSSTAPAKTKTVDSLPDISGIHLDGEETDNVPVYDTCDEIRRKINAHLKTPGLTQSQFCRDIYAQLRMPKCKSIQSKQLADFRAMKGPRAGAKSSVFYAAYVYFEKLRIAQKKPKTAHRETMEQLWAGEGGLDRETDHRTYYTLASHETLTIDQWGVERIE